MMATASEDDGYNLTWLGSRSGPPVATELATTATAAIRL